jgi:hypothetical protein
MSVAHVAVPAVAPQQSLLLLHGASIGLHGPTQLVPSQLFVARLHSHPFAYEPSQSANPLVQVVLQLPFWHFAVELEAAAHAEQEPQWFTSLPLMTVSQPFTRFPSQSP